VGKATIAGTLVVGIGWVFSVSDIQNRELPELLSLIGIPSLNCPQFLSFGVYCICKVLEIFPNEVAYAVPLTEKSTRYSFCFQNPMKEADINLQRKCAAVEAEKALENSRGCARTEGMSTVDKSRSIFDAFLNGFLNRVHDNKLHQLILF
jgi:hypothetical protein